MIAREYWLEHAAIQAIAAGVDMLLSAEDRLVDGRSAAVVALAALRRAVREGRLPVERIAVSLHPIHRLKDRR